MVYSLLALVSFCNMIGVVILEGSPDISVVTPIICHFSTGAVQQGVVVKLTSKEVSPFFNSYCGLLITVRLFSYFALVILGIHKVACAGCVIVGAETFIAYSESNVRSQPLLSFTVITNSKLPTLLKV